MLPKQTTTEKTVYLIRHGESEANASPVFQGDDSPLSAQGKIQAAQVAERAAKLSFEKLVSSPLLRTKETATAIAEKTGKSITYSEFFVERVKPSRIMGKSHDDQEASRVWDEWEKSLYTPNMHVEDGENFDDLIARADKALAFLSECPEKEIAVVSHGYFLRTIIARILLGDALTPEAFKNFQSKIHSPNNTALTVITQGKLYEGGTTWRLKIYNDHTHLG